MYFSASEDMDTEPSGHLVKDGQFDSDTTLVPRDPAARPSPERGGLSAPRMSLIYSMSLCTHCLLLVCSHSSKTYTE